jgi:hypothetical protein
MTIQKSVGSAIINQDVGANRTAMPTLVGKGA